MSGARGARFPLAAPPGLAALRPRPRAGGGARVCGPAAAGRAAGRAVAPAGGAAASSASPRDPRAGAAPLARPPRRSRLTPDPAPRCPARRVRGLVGWHPFADERRAAAVALPPLPAHQAPVFDGTAQSTCHPPTTPPPPP